MHGLHSDFDDPVTGLSFEKCGNSHAVVWGVMAPHRGRYVIPASVVDDEGAERVVLGISDYAFMDCTEVEEVVVSQFLHFIGCNAFMGCTSLRRFECMYFDELSEEDAIVATDGLPEINDTFTRLDSRAFAYCPNLLYVKGNFIFKPERTSVEIFEGCESLEEIDGSFMVNNVGPSDSKHFYGIPPRCFKNCKSLREVRIDAMGGQTDRFGHSEAHFESFAGCESLEHINGTMKIRTVYRDAFKDCDKLQDHPCAQDFYVGLMSNLE